MKGTKVIETLLRVKLKKIFEIWPQESMLIMYIICSWTLWKNTGLRHKKLDLEEDSEKIKEILVREDNVCRYYQKIW